MVANIETENEDNKISTETPESLYGALGDILDTFSSLQEGVSSE